MDETQARELAGLLAAANGNAPYLRVRTLLHALPELPDDAIPAVKARALGELFTALADALDDKDPLFESRRALLREYVSVTGNALAGVKKKHQKLESDHVVDLLRSVRQARLDAVDGFCTTRECFEYAVEWLSAHGYRRAIAHLLKHKQLTEETIAAVTAEEFNADLLRLVNADGFMSLGLSGLKKKKSHRGKLTKKKSSRGKRLKP